MIHTISNEALALEVNTLGAELHTLHSKDGPADGWLWNGEPTIWGRRAPVCFPWCGRMKDGYFEEGGHTFYAPIHGLVRDLDHYLECVKPSCIQFSLEWPGTSVIGQTPEVWPWGFRFETTHRLEEHALITVCTAINTGGDPMPVQLGFHTALRCPFDPQRTPEDYLLRFQHTEYPFQVICDSDGLVTGEEHPVFSGQMCIPLHTQLFHRDSICLGGLTSDWIQLEERNTGRALRLDISDYPYVLLWSLPGLPGFLCIEPWTGLPSTSAGGHNIWSRPGTYVLAPGGSFSRTQRITIIGASSSRDSSS